MDRSDYIFKRVDESRYKDLVAITSNAFGTAVKEEFYAAKMQTDALGVRHLGYVAYALNGDPAAFYGVYPCMVEYGGKTYLAAQSGDTMTHPAHQGKGLFTSLAKMTYELAKAEGVQFVFGFPNKNSYPGFVKKLNWTHKENMVNYQLNISTIPLAAASKKIIWLDVFYKIYLKCVAGLFKIDKPYLHSSIQQSDVGRVVRDEKYAGYKKFQGSFTIRVKELLAWVKVDGALLVGDAEIPKKSSLDSWLGELKRMGFLMGCNKIIFSVSPGTEWDMLLRAHFPASEGIYIGYVDLQSGLPIEKFKYTQADYDTF